MKIVKVEVATRYQINFTPAETHVLLKHPKWSAIVSTKSSEHNGHGSNPAGCAMFTKKQINEVCDVLGINGREFMASAVPPSVLDEVLAKLEAKADANPIERAELDPDMIANLLADDD